MPDEYTGSKDTEKLKGTVAKAKANAVQGIPELIEVSTNKQYTENRKDKHSVDAANGWYRMESRFALPIYGNSDEIERYNIFHVFLIIRYDRDGKKYLYDLINIKKETSTPLSYEE